jgi:threonine dehydrogenase-like Zn-dependent dehydrogenase
MRAAVAVDGEIVVERFDDPVPGPGQVLVASLANGICGSDLHLLDRQRAGDPLVGGARVVPGHEFCAEIVDHGPKADRATRERWPVGTRVCANPFVAPHEHVGGTPRLGGGLGQLMTLEAHTLLRVPEGLAAEHAALTEPLAVGIRAVNAAVARGDRGPVVVLGCGPIGLAVLLALRAVGVGPVVASDPAPARRALAERVGADVVVDPGTDSPFARLADLSFVEPAPSVMLGGTDAPAGVTIFECTGRPGMLAAAVGEAPRHSHVVVVGVCTHPETIVPAQAVVRELALDFVLAYRPADLAESLRRIADGVVDVTPVITGIVGLDAAPEAFGALRRGEHAKVVVMPGDAR